MNGKGSKRRPGNDEKYRENWDRIFNKENIRGLLLKIAHCQDKFGDFCENCQKRKQCELLKKLYGINKRNNINDI